MNKKPVGTEAGAPAPGEADKARRAAATNRPRARSSTGSTQELLHQLQVHQIELEMQNEALRQSQLALEESRDRYIDFYDFSPVGYLTLTEQGLVTEINLTGASMLGMDRAKVLQHRFGSSVAAEDRDNWHRHFGSAMRLHGKLECDVALLRPDRSRIEVRLNCLRQTREDQTPVLRVVLTDISEHKRAQEALRASEQKFRDYTDLSVDWYWEQDADFRFTHMSGGVVNKGNFRIADALGRTRWELPVTGVSAAQWIAHRAQLERHEPFHEFIYTIRAADDSLRWYSVSGKPLFASNGRFFGYRGTGSDITERVMSREKLEKALRWLEQAIRAAGMGLWERDIETWAFSFRDNWRALFGYAEHEIEDSAEDFDRLVHPDDLARIHAAGRAYTANPGDEYEVRFRILHRDGSWRWVLSRGNVMNDSAKGRGTFVGCHLDITEQIRAEQKIIELATLLEMRVKARTAELEEANRELDAFNFSVSHDLRTPLRAIDGFSRALLEDCDEQLDQTGREYLQRICRSTARMGELIDALYRLSRMSREPLHPGPVDLSAMARELVADLREQYPRRVARIEIAETPLAEGDPRLLRIVLANLLGNAWKFTGKTSPARIAFTARRDEAGCVVYSLRDNGAGFDMQFADKLFRVFHRLHREEEFPGQGVGLTTVQRIVARHGGRVWGEAVRGAGASFHFTLWTDKALLADAWETDA